MPRHFSDWLKAYMAFTSDSEAPDDMHFWTGVSTVAGALRARVWIDMRKFRWTSNFYIILVGPPGVVTKSTTIRSGIRLLEEVKGIHFGPPSTTWQALTDSLARAVEHLKLGADPTTGEDVFLPMSCLTISVSELGTFLKADDQGLIDVIVDLWDGQLTRWGHKTKTAGEVEIKNPWLNVIGCTTPSWMKLHIPEHMIGGGLLSRVLFVYGDRKRHLSAYPDEVIPDAEYRALETKLIEDLREIATLAGPCILSPEARDWGRKWYERHWNGERPSHMASNRYDGYLSRKQTHMHKLAIILSAAQRDDRVVTLEHLQTAEALLNSAEQHMMKAFESVGIVVEAQHSLEILSFLRTHRVLTVKQLWGLVGSLMNLKDFDEAVKAVVFGGQVKVVAHPSERDEQGRPVKALALSTKSAQ